MFRLIKSNITRKIVSIVSNPKLELPQNVSRYSNTSKTKFSYIDSRKLSKNSNSKVKKLRYNKGIR